MATPHFINPQLFQLPNRVNSEWELVNGAPCSEWRNCLLPTFLLVTG